MDKKILFQGVTPDNHLAAVKHLLSIPNPETIIFSTAFMTKSGLAHIENALRSSAAVTTIMAGIRNKITSAQGFMAVIEYGCTAYAVDTGTRNILFHPKIFLSKNADEARLIVGSANLTMGGLNSNIEASVVMTADLTNKQDAAFVADIEAKIIGMIEEYEEHVFQVPDQDMVSELLLSGRIVDESIAIAPTPNNTSSNRDLDTVSKMKLKTSSIKRPAIASVKAVIPKSVAKSPPSVPAAPSATPIATSQAQEKLQLVWESKPLKRRHLNIPVSSNTSPTGSMLLGKGKFSEINPREYFRNDVFGGLQWAHDDRPHVAHYERAEADFRIIIKNIDHGVYKLRLSHDARQDSPTLDQNNLITQLHWGTVTPLVTHEDLLDRTLYIYRDKTASNLFVLEID